MYNEEGVLTEGGMGVLTEGGMGVLTEGGWVC